MGRPGWFSAAFFVECWMQDDRLSIALVFQGFLREAVVEEVVSLREEGEVRGSY